MTKLLIIEPRGIEWTQEAHEDLIVHFSDGHLLRWNPHDSFCTCGERDCSHRYAAAELIHSWAWRQWQRGKQC